MSVWLWVLAYVVAFWIVCMLLCRKDRMGSTTRIDKENKR